MVSHRESLAQAMDQAAQEAEMEVERRAKENQERLSRIFSSNNLEAEADAAGEPPSKILKLDQSAPKPHQRVRGEEPKSDTAAEDASPASPPPNGSAAADEEDEAMATDEQAKVSGWRFTCFSVLSILLIVCARNYTG